MKARPDLGIDGEPELRFQPAVDMATGRLLGFEALLRWNDPVRGVLAPDVILSWAETNDLMTALNAWILFEACSMAVEWGSSLQLAVNCSASELRKRKATLAVVFALEQSGLNPDRLTVEVADLAMCDNVIIGELYSLSRLGVQLAVDNVGPNWTGIDQPQHFAVNMVKIGRGLVADIESADGTNRTIIERLIRTSHARGISLVAGGIETERQEAIVRELGVDVGQGYFYSPPLSADDTRSLTAAAHWGVSLGSISTIEGQPVVAPFGMDATVDSSSPLHHYGHSYAHTFGEPVTYSIWTATDGSSDSRRRNRVPSSFRRGRHSSS